MSRGLAYCHGPLKRALDLGLSATGLLVLAPVLLALGLAVFLGMGLPVLFVQERVGIRGRLFRLYKLRTMRRAAPGGLLITGSGDPRVTRLGRFLRATKLDELPQLWNVLWGEMSLVGPRPEVPKYVARYTLEQKRVLQTRPGLTDPASVLFRNEEDLIASAPEGDRERFYIETILPKKLGINLRYIDEARLTYDLLLIVRTVQAVLLPGPVRLT